MSPPPGAGSDGTFRQPSTAALRDPMEPIALEARGVTKRFGGLTAVDHVDLKIPQGAIQGLIGPNGAGKTTFFNIVAGIYQLTDGRDPLRGLADPRRPRRLFRKSQALAAGSDRGARHRPHVSEHPPVREHDARSTMS